MKKFFLNFKQLPLSTKSMVYLMWIYFVGVIISTTFVNIYVFQLEGSYSNVLIFNLITFTAGGTGFVGMGILFSLLQRNVSQMYYIGYIFFILSFILLFIFPYNLYATYFYAVLYGLGAGIYWNAVHSQELQNIKNSSRDFYSSSISAGSNLISVFIPLLISGIFLLGDQISFDGYGVLFFILPLLYSVSFLFIKNIPVYVPKKIKISDIFACFNLADYKYGNMYLLCSGAKHGIVKGSIAVSSILLLQNEINIGLFQGILAFFSSYVVIHFGLKRNIGNRGQFFLYICSLLAASYFLLAMFFNIYAFLLFSFSNLFLFSMYRVSAHTYDLAVMDSNRSKDQDFYPRMLGREILLVISRGSSILLMLGFILSTNISSEGYLRISFVFVGIFLLGEIISIRLWEKYEK